ncbi:hypothetical protein MMC29_007800 [Sticta canariensis]|nr:hypothetical protein [Sticta canariensis]
MRFFRAMMQSSMLQFSTLLLSAIVLVHFDIPKTALAQPGPPGPNRRFTTPVECDYPDDETIRSDFMGINPDQTVDFADPDTPSNGQVGEFCFLYQLKRIHDCFPSNYLRKGERSDRWYLDFYYRFSVIYLQAARGWVHLLSRADGPRDSLVECIFWFRVQSPTLRTNEAVLGIVVVNVEDYEDQWIYWIKGDGDQARRRARPGGDGNGNGGNGNGRGGDGKRIESGNEKGGDFTEWSGNGNGHGNDGSVWNVLTGVLGTELTHLQTSAIGFGATGLEAWRAFLGGRKHPSTPAGDPNHRMDQPDPGTKTDILNLKIGELPDFPDGIDETSTMAAIDPTAAADDFEANDETSEEEELGIGGVLNTDEVWGKSNTATSLKLFGRSHRMHSRTVVGTCNGDDWVEDPWNPDFPRLHRLLEDSLSPTLAPTLARTLYIASDP